MDYILPYIKGIINNTDLSPKEYTDEILIHMYALLAMTKGRETTAEDVHDAWSLWRALTIPDHKSIIPYKDLTPEIQAYDFPYVDAIHKAAEENNG